MLLPQDLKFSGEKCAKRVILFKKNLQLCVKTVRYNMQKCVKTQKIQCAVMFVLFLQDGSMYMSYGGCQGICCMIRTGNNFQS